MQIKKVSDPKNQIEDSVVARPTPRCVENFVCYNSEISPLSMGNWDGILLWLIF